MPNLVLYKMDTCPYCQKVMRYVASEFPHPDAIAYRDITTDAGARDELVRVGGKAQVPCLFVDGSPMYESDDIVAYLKTLAD